MSSPPCSKVNCTSKCSKYLVEGEYVCGRHCPVKMRLPENEVANLPQGAMAMQRLELSPSSPTASAASASPASPTSTEDLRRRQYDAIMFRVDAVDQADKEGCEKLTERDVALIRSIGRMSEEHFMVIMATASEYAGSNVDIARLIESLVVAGRDFNRARNDQYVHIPEPLQSVLPDNVTVSHEFGEIEYPDVDVLIINLNKLYLSKKGISSFHEWLADPTSVYVGPTRVGSETYPSNSYYIPLSVENPNRVMYNKRMVEIILARIKNGEESKEKYTALKGKTLGCFCSPFPCHAQVYAEVLRALR
jgi:hypothetical protein